MGTENHKIIKGCHVAFDSKPSEELESAISKMIDIAREKIDSGKVSICLFKYDCNYKGEGNKCLASISCDLKQTAP